VAQPVLKVTRDWGPGTSLISTLKLFIRLGQAFRTLSGPSLTPEWQYCLIT